MPFIHSFIHSPQSNVNFLKWKQDNILSYIFLLYGILPSLILFRMSLRDTSHTSNDCVAGEFDLHQLCRMFQTFAK